MTDAVSTGARREEGVHVCAKSALHGTLEDLLWADGVLFGTPENFGTMSGALKYFFDETFYPAQGKIRKLPYGLYIKCENDGTGAAREVERILKGYPMMPVSDPIICRGEVDAEIVEACEALGQTLAAGLVMGLWQ